MKSYGDVHYKTYVHSIVCALYCLCSLLFVYSIVCELYYVCILLSVKRPLSIISTKYTRTRIVTPITKLNDDLRK